MIGRKSSFYYSFLALPAPKRRAMFAVFDFCRAVDDAVDLAPNEEAARAGVLTWRKEVEAVFEQGAPATPQGRALQPIAIDLPLSRGPFDDLVDGVEMDLTPRRYVTFEELEQYCHRVASAVGLMCAEVFGARTAETEPYARDLGVALQLTNILRDVATDFRRGRLYLPLDDLSRFQCTEQDIKAEVERGGSDVRSERVRTLLEHQAARARVFFARAVRQLPAGQARRLVAAEIMHAIYRDLLRRIEAAGCGVFGPRIRVPRPAQAAIALRVWWKLRR